MSGFFLTVDGVDGAGKSTQLAFIRSWLKDRGVEAVFTREPGGTQLGEVLRQLLLDSDLDLAVKTEVLLMYAARAEHLAQVILPSLAAGRWVVCDRFSDATFAYQCGGRGFPQDKLAVLQAWVEEGLRPDMTIVLDVPVAVSVARVAQGGQLDRLEQEGVDFFERVRAVYLQRAAADVARYAVVRSDADVAVVQDRVAEVLSGCLNRWEGGR